MYTYSENKTKAKTSPCLCMDHPLCWPPLCLASHSHWISLLGWRQFASWKTHIQFSGCFSKANQSHPAWIPTTSTNPLFAGLCKAFQVVSTGGNAGGEGRTHQSELYPPFPIQEWALIWAFETHRFIAVSQFSGKFSLVTKLNLSSRLWFDPINIWNKFKQCFSTWI